MKETYRIKVAGLERDLPICPLNEKLCIAGFVIFGDMEMTRAASAELLKKAPEHDIMITAESKGLPLVYEMARQGGEEHYVLARKAPKLYMKNICKVDVKSITTDWQQSLYLDGSDAEMLRGKRVLIVDDVISTGNSLRALETLVKAAGGNICGRMAVLAEGEAADRKDIIFLEKLPLFDSEGEPLKD